MNTTVLCFHTLSCIFPLPSFPTSLLSNFLKKKQQQNKKQQEQVTKKFSEWKQAHVGMERSKSSRTRWERHHNTFTPSLHLVPFCQLCTTKKLFTHSLNEHNTQHCSLHSLPHKRQSISVTFTSNKIWQHNLNSQHTI